MKTEILTSELQKIIDPSVDGIYCKGKKIKVDLVQLSKYVNDPKKYNVFKLTDDTLKNLYKNLALYIINSNEPTLISLDLNNPQIFPENKGLFEYIKNIYTQQELSFIELDEIGDNLLLIESQKLSAFSPLSEKSFLSNAEDMHYATAATALASPELRQKTRGQIHWNDSNSELYGDLKFVIEKIKEQFPSSTTYYLNTDYDTPFDSLIKKINPVLLNSVEFKIALLGVNSEPLHHLLVTRFAKKDDKYFIDFSQPEIQTELLKNIQDNEFVALERLFSEAIKKEMGEHLLQTIDFKSLLNQPETIQYLVAKEIKDKNYYSNKENGITIKHIYPFLSLENRTYLPVMEKYAKLICEKNMDRRIYIYERHLYELEPIAFNEKSVISIVANGIDFGRLNLHLKSNGIDCPLLSDTQFILSLADKVSGDKLADWIANFVNKSDLNTEFIQSLVKVNGDLYDSLKDKKTLAKFQRDVNVIRAMVNSPNSDYNCSRLSPYIMTPLLLEDHDEEFEMIKIKYLIGTGSLENIRWNKSLKDLDLIKVKEKYHKPEYLFYASHWGHTNEVGSKSLGSLTKAEEVFEILEKIKKQAFNFTFQSNQFYESLPKALKRNKEVMFKILELGEIKYSSLEPTLAYNSDIAITFLKRDPKNIQVIPEELFTNAKFAIQFARLVDNRVISREILPTFVKSFFDRHDIKQNFEEFIMQHLNYTNLQADLDKPQVVANKPKKVKI